MYQINPAEMLHERHAELLREAAERRLARRLRARGPQRSPRTEGGRLRAGFLRAVSSWGATSIPFFRV